MQHRVGMQGAYGSVIEGSTGPNDGLRGGQRLALREQLAVVRTLADQLERLTGPGAASGTTAQLAEELARFGCLVLDAAAAVSNAGPPKTEPRRPVAASTS
jgi:hypothetical protein